MADVFIAHAAEDTFFARRVGAVLANDGYEVWLDTACAWGRPMEEAIGHKIAASRAVIVLLSAEAARSACLRAEVEFAHSVQRSIIPILLDVERGFECGLKWQAKLEDPLRLDHGAPDFLLRLINRLRERLDLEACRSVQEDAAEPAGRTQAIAAGPDAENGPLRAYLAEFARTYGAMTNSLALYDRLLAEAERKSPSSEQRGRQERSSIAALFRRRSIRLGSARIQSPHAVRRAPADAPVHAGDAAVSLGLAKFCHPVPAFCLPLDPNRMLFEAASVSSICAWMGRFVCAEAPAMDTSMTQDAQPSGKRGLQASGCAEGAMRLERRRQLPDVRTGDQRAGALASGEGLRFVACRHLSLAAPASRPKMLDRRRPGHPRILDFLADEGGARFGAHHGGSDDPESEAAREAPGRGRLASRASAAAISHSAKCGRAPVPPQAAAFSPFVNAAVR